MADITKTIGTDSRDYSTIAAFEADLDDSGIYSSGDNAIGEMYDDSAFDEAVTFNGGATVGLSSIKLTVAEGERHDGTAGTGARMVASANSRILRLQEGPGITVEWLEWDGNGFAANYSANEGNFNLYGAQQMTINRCIVHDDISNASGCLIAARIGSFSGIRVQNCIAYDRTGNSTVAGQNSIGISLGNIGGRDSYSLNCTVHNIVRNNSDGAAVGITSADAASNAIVNCISMDMSGTGSGVQLDFSPTSFSNADCDHNMSSDTSASGTGSLTEKASSDQFVSTVDGSEDYHLKTGADAIDVGTDLGSLNDVAIDIDGRDRDAEGDTWDMGADEFVAEGGGASRQRTLVGVGL